MNKILQFTALNSSPIEVGIIYFLILNDSLLKLKYSKLYLWHPFCADFLLENHTNIFQRFR